MAKLETFFHKLSRHSDVTVSEVPDPSADVMNHNDVKCIDGEAAKVRKRGRPPGSTNSNRLSICKKLKPSDENDAARETPEPPAKVDAENLDGNAVGSKSVEISYEELLSRTGVVHLESTTTYSDDESEEEVAEVKDKVKKIIDRVVTDNTEPPKKKDRHENIDPKKQNEAAAKEPSRQLESYGKSSVADGEEVDTSDRTDDISAAAQTQAVAGKDIRSFFGKAALVAVPQSCATLVKVRAEVYLEPGVAGGNDGKMVRTVARTGSELARKQRASIVITDADLSIDVIEVLTPMAASSIDPNNGSEAASETTADDKSGRTASKDSSIPLSENVSATIKSPCPPVAIPVNNSSSKTTAAALKPKTDHAADRKIMSHSKEIVSAKDSSESDARHSEEPKVENCVPSSPESVDVSDQDEMVVDVLDDEDTIEVTGMEKNSDKSQHLKRVPLKFQSVEAPAVKSSKKSKKDGQQASRKLCRARISKNVDTKMTKLNSPENSSEISAAKTPESLKRSPMKISTDESADMSSKKLADIFTNCGKKPVDKPPPKDTKNMTVEDDRKDLSEVMSIDGSHKRKSGKLKQKAADRKDKKSDSDSLIEVKNKDKIVAVVSAACADKANRESIQQVVEDDDTEDVIIETYDSPKKVVEIIIPQDEKSGKLSSKLEPDKVSIVSDVKSPKMADIFCPRKKQSGKEDSSQGKIEVIGEVRSVKTEKVADIFMPSKKKSGNQPGDEKVGKTDSGEIIVEDKCAVVSRKQHKDGKVEKGGRQGSNVVPEKIEKVTKNQKRIAPSFVEEEVTKRTSRSRVVEQPEKVERVAKQQVAEVPEKIEKVTRNRKKIVSSSDDSDNEEVTKSTSRSKVGEQPEKVERVAKQQVVEVPEKIEKVSRNRKRIASSSDDTDNEETSKSTSQSKDTVVEQSEKLADVFTPRSRKCIETEDSVVEKEKTSFEAPAAEETDNRRHSRRLSARAAANAIARVFEKAPKKVESDVESNDHSETEIIDVEESDRAKPRCKSKKSETASETASAKLAPIFEKRKDPAPPPPPKVLTAAEQAALLVRRAFLTSGVPVELRRQQASQLPNSAVPVDAEWPTQSHMQQRSAIDQTLWNLPEVQLPYRNAPEASTVSVLAPELKSLGCITDALCRSPDASYELPSCPEFSEEMKTLLGSEIQSYNSSFPVARFYKQLSAKKNKSENLSKLETGKPDVAVLADADSTDLDETSGDVLWTEKYAPCSALELVGNWSACKKLREWLAQWKERIGRFAQKASTGKHKTSRQQQSSGTAAKLNNSADDFDRSADSFDSDIDNDDDNSLFNAMLLCGPHGIGKTAMVYAVARELGFKVFEVNSSDQRDGKHVLTQLQEATQSHQLPRTVLAAAAAAETTTAKAASVLNAKSNKKKSSQQKKKPGAFASIFAKAGGDRVSKKSAASAKSEPPPAVKLKPKAPPGAQSEKVTNLSDLAKASLILFDEVDVVLNDDRGFWAAVETFMSITKRPILLTASDPRLVGRFPGHVELLRLHVPQFTNTASFLQTVCLVEGIRTSFADILSLVSLVSGDIRRALLTLHSWTSSGGARRSRTLRPIYATSPATEAVPDAAVAAPAMSEPVTKPPSVALASVAALGSASQSDSEDDFVKIRPRRLRRCINPFPSDDDDSRTLDAAPTANDCGSQSVEISIDVDDGSQQSLGDFVATVKPAVIFVEDDDSQSQSSMQLASCAGKNAEAKTVVVDALHAPQLHRLELVFLDRCCPYNLLQRSAVESERLPPVTGDYWRPKQQILDCALPHLNVANSRSASGTKPASTDASSLRSLYLLYKDYSAFDSLYSRLHDTEENPGFVVPGNADFLMREEQFNGVYRNVYGTMEELKRNLETATRTTADELRRLSGGREESSFDESDVDWFRFIHQDVNRFEKMAQQTRSSAEYVRCHLIGLSGNALVSDYLPALRAVAKSEAYRQATNSKRRFYHYMRSTFPDLKSSVLNQLCGAFVV